MSDLQLTIIGCDGSWPGPNGGCSSYLLRNSTTAVLIDIGGGSLANLQMHIDPRQLDAILISHEHPDHCADLAPLGAMFRHSTHPFNNLPVYVAPGVKEQVFPRTQLTNEFEWTELEDADEIEIGDFAIKVSQTDHPVVTFAIRVDCGNRSFAYTADTGTDWALSALGTGIDLALCEAAFPGNDFTPSHINSEQAAQMAKDAGAQRLMLTHIRPDFDREQMRKEAETVFEGEVLLAVAGETITV